MERLRRYRWPGNVRELENLMRRLAALTPRASGSPSSSHGPILSKTQSFQLQNAVFSAGNVVVELHRCILATGYVVAKLPQKPTVLTRDQRRQSAF
jgi:DNA-binding NtrC family response regulator